MANSMPSSFQSTFCDALCLYKKRTRKDILLHPLATKLQTCDSPSAVISVLQEQTQVIDQSGSGSETLTKYITPTVNVLSALSSSVQEGISLVLSPAKVIFVGIGVLLSVAPAVGASQDGLIDILGRMEHILRRLDPFITNSLPRSMKDTSEKILLVVFTILTSVTEEITQGRAKKYLKQLTRRNVVDDALRRLDKLTPVMPVTSVGMAPNISVIGERINGQETEVAVVQGTDDAANPNRSHTPSAVTDEGSSSRLRDQLQSWLSPSDPSMSHNIAQGASHMGIGRWFLRSRVFNQWKSIGSLLWIHGKPGSGKSVLCSTVIEDIKVMCEAQLASMAYFHFDFRDIHKQSRRDVISSLLFQLSTQSNRRHDILYRSFLAQDSGAQRPSDSILTECLKDMLLMPSEVPIYIIMDAIDECPNTSGIPSSRKEILDLVEELIGLSLPNLRLCVTNRSDFDIRVVLEPLSSFRVSLHDEIGQKQDIANYIKAVVYSDPKMRIWRAEDKELVINVLTERADGMLRWVFFQLEALRRCSPPNIRRVLDEFPEMLGETYERILMEIGNEKREYARRLLQCVAVAIRPLRVEELAEVLAVDFDTGGAIPKHHLGRRQEDQEAVILSTCSSLVTIANIDDSKVVQLSHFSVNAFLTSNRLATSSGRVSFYHISLETAHTIIAQACLGVLLRLKDHLDRDNVEKIPLAEYAAKHWVDHARFENVAFHVQERMELLFDPEEPYFANWLRIYDMDEPLGTPHLIRPAPLYYAALCGLPSLAERLIVKRPMDVNARGGHYVTAIQAALYKRHLSIVRVLMEHGVDVNLRDDEGMSLLHLAAQIGDPEAVSLLMSRGTDVDSGHSSMLFMALNSGNLAETRLLLDHGVDANARDEKLSTALHISSDNGYFDLVRLLLQYGADVNPRDNHDSTPLHLASAKGHSRVVSLLMNYGADMNASDNTNSTPLRLAFINQDLGIAELLIESGADVNVLDRVLDNKPLAPLHLALSKGNARLVNLLVRRGINVNGRDDNNMTPLHLASAKGNHTAVGLLIDHAAEVNASDNTNSTPLHLALINENFDIALLLIERSAHVTVADNKKLVPLHLALLSKNFDLVDLLIGLGADVNACSNDNSTPLHVASRHGHRKFVDLLLEHGGDPNLRNDSGFSPLHIASLEGDVDIAESLLEGGAKANLKDWNRKTPLHLASNNKKMARLLIRHGADAFALDNKDAMPLRYGEDIERARRMAENTVTLGAHV